MTADQNNIERELGWDETIENDSPEFVVLPEGEYGFEVISFERGRHTPKEGGKLPPCNKAVIKIRVTAPEGVVTMEHNLYLHTRTEGLLCAFFTSIGQRKHGEPLKMNWPATIGARGRCKLIVDTWISNNSGKEMKNNKVDRFLEPADEATPAFEAGRF